MNIKTDIIEMLRTKGDGVTFVNLASIPGFEGDTGLEIEGKNIFLWFHCSVAAIQAIKDLLNERQIELHPTTHLTYVVDGRIPTQPLARSDRAYKTPHWAPMALKRGMAFQ